MRQADVRAGKGLLDQLLGDPDANQPRTDPVEARTVTVDELGQARSIAPASTLGRLEVEPVIVARRAGGRELGHSSTQRYVALGWRRKAHIAALGAGNLSARGSSPSPYEPPTRRIRPVGTRRMQLARSGASRRLFWLVHVCGEHLHVCERADL